MTKKVNKIEIKLIKSPIGYNVKKKHTLEALGLTKMNAVVVKNADSAILGMIKKVFHLVEVKEI
ncbi:MAG: 50S ribosomal protein L30 [Candidatus Marinimicrobia bacterium]|nr:50S ribosomal protein L30 [Candidatus Neomarinimicrobiota bacterium]|tara:strand:+ start:23994 stop:24185 length:192 start_codon:yes stop_codon:yes gene_type:complete